jgi:hypothetical protein
MKDCFYTEIRHKFITFLLIILSIFTITTGCGSGSGGGGGGSLISESDGSSPDTTERSITLSWDEPADSEDVSGYKIYYGSTSGNYDNAKDIGNVTIYTLSHLQGETICFALTAFNSSGNESGYSNEICI